MSEVAGIETEAEVHHAHKDDEGAKLGMWIFLFTELMLFGGLFLLYMGYRYVNQDAFVIAASELDVAIGTLNTIILLTSSLTMALSIAALQKGNKVLSLIFLGSTFLLAVSFLINKYFEWSAKFAHGIYPGSPELANKGNGEILFFGLYYVMTGLHGIHVIIGMIIMSFMTVFILRGSVTPGNYVKLENCGLYWHLVDLIWIFLFPLFYLLH